MSTTHDIRATVWFSAGVPSGVVWEARHHRVTDTPTRLEDELEVLTHPPGLRGWRFQGTDSQGLSRMFDIARRKDEWVVLRVYV